MFGFGKKRLLRKMDGLSSVAQMAIYLSLKEKNEKVMDGESALLFAAAVSNYLFGKSANQRHIEQFTLEKIESTGNQLIKDNKSIRELVVQSLRVVSTVSVAAGKEAVGMNILSVYGREFPQSPDPGSYAELVHKSIKGMSPSVQQSLAQIRR